MSEDVLEVAVAELRPSLEALLMIADSPAPPRWSETNPRATRYLKARKGR